ncbi:MAG: 2-succinyl-5-enolpyruvyl-6-hydroxy-3-cyclohexene-carboxylate synthase, partial [Candidatus Hydrogenedentes bacterium]|nr:2-succinyl-5-enolpyruvyl-6-hydroxy-3-cyclohexene-carboxylate synthase [Candidatus Hydrogenedentota bacterium]
MLNTTNINSLWGALIVEELRRNGVRFFCVSPGSRSAPLTVAVAENPGVEHVVHFDERGAAYHALGIARATGAPVALVCTSGTAVANYLPAVVEASQSRVPLILLTADRPPELLDAGANQTIGQPGIFGSYTRWAFTLPCPDTVIAPETVLTTIDQAVYRARRAPSGPVHLNCQYREPLAPVSANEDLGVYAARLASWREASAPWTSYSVPTTEPSDLDALIQLIRTAQSGILAVGRLDSPDEREAVRTLARVLGWPAFPDVASGLRLGAPDVPFISHYDLLLLSKAFRDRCVPDVVLHIGGPVTSKRWMHYIEAVNPRHYILAANHPMRQDPAHRVTERIEADLPHFCHALAGPLDRAAKTDHTRHFIEADQRVRELLEARLDGDGPLTEPAVARIVSRHAPA